MDLLKTGKFIADRRKQKELTQAELANIIGISEKTVSKWECGNGFPDTSLMLPLCEALDISANELLSGKELSDEEYKTNAEKNLILLKSRQDKSVKHLLSLECVIGYMTTFTYFLLLLCAIFAVENLAWRITIICLSVLILLVGVIFALRVEQVAGFYECEHCHHKYIPTYHAVLFAMHIGRTRYMKCPKCGKRTWNKKVISDDW